MAKPKTAINYETLRAELDTIVDELQHEDLTVDKALAHSERGLELTQQLEKHLKTAENKRVELKAKFDANSA